MTQAPSLKGGGNPSASIMVVTEFATADDLWKQCVLGGKQGEMFRRMLLEARIIPTSTYMTAALKYRVHGDDANTLYTQTKSTAQKLKLTHVLHDTWVSPSLIPGIEALHAEIAAVNPKVIIAVGDFAMFATAGVYGSVDTWRGSMLECSSNPDITVIPTYTPEAITKRWEVKGFASRDLQRAEACAMRPEAYRYPKYEFTIRPTFDQVRSTLLTLLETPLSGNELLLSVDLETIARHISCVGLAWSCREAICIPFLTLDGDYFSEDEEVQIHFLLRELLTHPNTKVLGQNFNYDNQHFAKHLGYLPNQTEDTMLAQHVLFPGIPKSLDFLSSMYCHFHRYWKDEMNDYTRLPENMEQYWTYNCKDTVVTFEVMLVLRELLQYYAKESHYQFLMETARSVLRTMLIGCRINQKERSAAAASLMASVQEYDALISYVAGEPLNVGSPKQLTEFFYEKMNLPVQRDRKTKRPTCNEKALDALAAKEPLFKPLVELINKRRSAAVSLKTFCLMPLDVDGRMRCSFNVAGAETFRFSSSTNAFGTGGNLQNITKGEEK